MAKGASFNRGASKQDVETPRDLIAAVEARFGALTADLAATNANAKAPNWWTKGDIRPWPVVGHNWLNPPFAQCAEWSKRCAQWLLGAPHGARLSLLVPASVSSNWYADHVHGRALVLPLRPRVKFVGHEHGFPKDLMLVVYGERPGVEPWRWKPDARPRRSPNPRRRRRPK